MQDLSTKQRCRVIGSVAEQLCDRSDALIEACESEQRTDPVETITSELLPLCAALKFIRRRGHKVLSDRNVPLAGRPMWLMGVHSRVCRVPLGDVLVLGTWNYPLLLPGVQIAQALAAGNRVQLKPAIGTEAASSLLVEAFHQSGVSPQQLKLLDSSTDAARQAIESGVDLVVLTGAAETGRRVLESAAPHLTPAIMELSGCDAAIVLPGFDPERLVDCMMFGLRFNSGATCIGPRRLIATRDQRERFMNLLINRLRQAPAVTVHPAARRSAADLISDALAMGAVDLLQRYDADELREHGKLFPILLDGVRDDHAIASADVFAPVLSLMQVDAVSEAIELVNACRYRLAASVFGPRKPAQQIAGKLDVGTVTINDLIAPTADPRLPFGGRGQSGFGVTRGVEGLLGMTTAKVISTRRGSFLPHLRERQAGDRALLHGVLQFLHAGSLSKRIKGLRK